MKRPKIGDIIEIKTSKGFAYALYTHRHTAHPPFGALIRVFSGLHSERQHSYSSIVAGDILFSNFIALGAAVSRGSVEVVGHIEIPPNLKAFPVFRTGFVDPRTRRVEAWWLWDGDKEWRVGNLTPEQACLPIRGVWGDLFLIERVEQQWRAETDPFLGAFPLV